MSDRTPRRDPPHKILLDIADEDIYEAMKEVHGYLDITTEDFHELYRFAYRHAIERLTGSIKARDIMTTKVVTVAVGTHIDEVAGVMARHSLKAVPVVDAAGMVVGVISEPDYLRQFNVATVMGFILKYLHKNEYVTHSLHEKSVEDIMSTPAITFRADTTFLDMMATFKQHAINLVPVVDAGGRPLGVVSRKDLVRACAIETIA